MKLINSLFLLMSLSSISSYGMDEKELKHSESLSHSVHSVASKRHLQLGKSEEHKSVLSNVGYKNLVQALFQEGYTKELNKDQELLALDERELDLKEREIGIREKETSIREKEIDLQHKKLAIDFHTLETYKKEMSPKYKKLKEQKYKKLKEQNTFLIEELNKIKEQLVSLQMENVDLRATLREKNLHSGQIMMGGAESNLAPVLEKVMPALETISKKYEKEMQAQKEYYHKEFVKKFGEDPRMPLLVRLMEDTNNDFISIEESGKFPHPQLLRDIYLTHKKFNNFFYYVEPNRDSLSSFENIPGEVRDEKKRVENIFKKFIDDAFNLKKFHVIGTFIFDKLDKKYFEKNSGDSNPISSINKNGLESLTPIFRRYGYLLKIENGEFRKLNESEKKIKKDYEPEHYRLITDYEKYYYYYIKDFMQDFFSIDSKTERFDLRFTKDKEKDNSINKLVPISGYSPSFQFSIAETKRLAKLRLEWYRDLLNEPESMDIKYLAQKYNTTEEDIDYILRNVNDPDLQKKIDDLKDY